MLYNVVLILLQHPKNKSHRLELHKFDSAKKLTYRHKESTASTSY